MRSPKARRGLKSAAVLLSAGLVLAACGGDDGGTQTAGGTSPGEGKAGCEGLTEFGDLSGTDVNVYTSIAPEDASHKESYNLFTECTGAEVVYEGSKEFEAQLIVRVKSGNPPDIAYVPQPGLLNTLVTDTQKVVAAPETVSANVDEIWGEDWKAYGTVDDTFYAAPLGANVKSFVWYSPSMFEENGWKIPETWDDMTALSDEIASAGDMKPWCAGIGSGDATGWVVTDWMEDVVLRDLGPDVYDQWVSNEVAFNDPEIVAALDRVGGILKNEDYVNGGFGDVKSIATTEFTDGGLPILDGECAMHRQASFYAANWPEGTKVAEDGDVFAFYLPPVDPAAGKPVLGAGNFVAAFSDRPEVQAFQTYLSSDTWANEKGKATPNGGFVSSNKGLDVANVASAIDKASVEILQDPEAVFRFDGSDLMPGAVGAGSFWKQMTAWITGASSQAAADAIEKSWPKS
ncbi:MAG: carbohydrate ABC transporter substrate-binding protein [Nocardioidaceae bacterium]|nr:carbohydrate ABC transporter substrate-binding protein [Nocardioidaceae bacterium]